MRQFIDANVRLVIQVQTVKSKSTIVNRNRAKMANVYERLVDMYAIVRWDILVSLNDSRSNMIIHIFRRKLFDRSRRMCDDAV